MEEQSLIKGCLNNNPLCQRELFNRYSPKLLAVCMRYAFCREDAEDMLQEGFINIFRQLHTFEGKGAFEGWMRRIIVNNCINNLKKNKKFSDMIDIDAAMEMPNSEESFPSIMHGKQVLAYIRSLPVGYRTVINLYSIEGFSHKEISEMLGIAESTSRSQYTRAKTILENMLLKEESREVLRTTPKLA